MIQSLIHLFERDLSRLEKEVTECPDHVLWQVSGDVKNSPGNLCLHVCGNLQHFFGSVLGNDGYVRNREFEFSATGLSRDELAKEIAAARLSVVRTLETLPPNRLHETYPIAVFGEPMTVEFFILHLSGHLNYHLGQMNYLRRVLV
jgi:hypothetical protein